MLGPSLGRRIPIVSRSIVKAAVAACPMGEIGESPVEELQIVREQLPVEFSDFNLSSSFHKQWRGFPSYKRVLSEQELVSEIRQNDKSNSSDSNSVKLDSSPLRMEFLRRKLKFVKDTMDDQGVAM